MPGFTGDLDVDLERGLAECASKTIMTHFGVLAVRQGPANASIGTSASPSRCSISWGWCRSALSPCIGGTASRASSPAGSEKLRTTVGSHTVLAGVFHQRAQH